MALSETLDHMPVAPTQESTVQAQGFWFSSFKESVARTPCATAFCNSTGEALTYAKLDHFSDAIACALITDARVTPGQPIVVYGHKAALMPVCLMAALKSGHPYIAVDIAFPVERIKSILEQTDQPLVLDTTAAGIAGLENFSAGIITRDALLTLCETWPDASMQTKNAPSLPYLGPNDVFYLLFTSGSTGTPKGIEITRRCVDNFCLWMTNEFGPWDTTVTFNKAPFSFDVSLTDFGPELAQGGTMCALEAEHEENLADTFKAFASWNFNRWISTPSFVEMCLIDSSFNANLLPNLNFFLLAGEVLRPQTVATLHERFPSCRVINAYGPTEATDLVSACEITPEMIAKGDLPIGYAMGDTDLYVLNPETLEVQPNGTPGELFIVGNTVAQGYYKRPDLTDAAFHSCPEAVSQGRASFRTGDECVRTEDGLYYYHGRLDLQIKLHGYRIELGDIEAKLTELPEVGLAVVVPVTRNNVISHLCAFIMTSDTSIETGFALTRQLKAKLTETLPAYMIPRSFKYPQELPVNPSGKIDRKELAKLA